MHYHLIEHIISKVTLMEVEKAIWLFYDSYPLCWLYPCQRVLQIALSQSPLVALKSDFS